MAKTIIRVSAQALTGKAGGWRYVAHYADGSTETIRAKATRLYTNAYQWDFRACSGPNPDSLAARFTFGASPAYPKRVPVNVFRIEEV